MSTRPKASSFVLVVGHRPVLEVEDGAAAHLRQLGASVLLMDFWDEVASILPESGAAARAIVVEAGDRLDFAMASLRAVRRDPRLEATPAIIAVPARQITRVEPTSGFDDFITIPYVPAELYARIRQLEWKMSEFSTDERLKIGKLVIDRAAHEVALDGRAVVMTAKEFALLAFLASNRGRVFSRNSLLARVWGANYEGGARTVDIHVRRLRAKLGDALPLETLRGAGYKLRAPSEVEGDGAASLDQIGPIVKAITLRASRSMSKR
ncbi:MAG: winged helix-turn-helix domain-containing protein [Polyangiaceae bacterium]